MSLKIIDENICLNDVVIKKKSFESHEGDLVEVLNIQREHIEDFYKLKSRDICDSLEVYCDIDNSSLNLFKEEGDAFISKAIEILDKENEIAIETFNKLVSNDFANVDGIEIVADEDSIEDSLNILLSSKLDHDESVKQGHERIDNAYRQLVKEIF
ncbi:MAG: hypothetical protein ACQERD_09065 [Campylobacterota bacterium]